MSIVDNLGHIPQAHIKALRTGTNQALPNIVWTTVAFNLEGTGNNATYKVSRSGGTFTIQIAGWYEVTYHIVIDWSAGGTTRQGKVKVNNVTIEDLTATYAPISSGPERQAINCSCPIYLDVDDDLIVQVYQNSGGQITISGRDETFIKLLKK